MTAVFEPETLAEPSLGTSGAWTPADHLLHPSELLSLFGTVIAKAITTLSSDPAGLVASVEAAHRGTERSIARSTRTARKQLLLARRYRIEGKRAKALTALNQAAAARQEVQRLTSWSQQVRSTSNSQAY